MLGESNETVAKKDEGTMYFMAPESCDGNQRLILRLDEIKDCAGKPLDIWALAVTAFILTFKDFPFKAENQGDIIELLDLIAAAK